MEKTVKIIMNDQYLSGYNFIDNKWRIMGRQSFLGGVEKFLHQIVITR